MDGNVTIPATKVVTVKEIKVDFFLTNEHFGIFSALDFAFVRPAESAEIPSPTATLYTPQNTQLPTPARILPQSNGRQEVVHSGRRRALKRELERKLGQTLEWHDDGYLYYAGTEKKVLDSPYKPSTGTPLKPLTECTWDTYD